MKKNNKGFTLIELLAVIVIMGILMMVAIPAMSKVIENSRKDTFIETAKTYTNAVNTLWKADSLYCGSEGKVPSTMKEGDYYILIDSNDTGLIERGGKSSWGNKDVKGYVKVTVSFDSNGNRKETYSVALTDSIHGIEEKNIDTTSLTRSDVLLNLNKVENKTKLENINKIPFEPGKVNTCVLEGVGSNQTSSSHPVATGTVMSLDKFRTNCSTLTGSIVFSREKAPTQGVIDISEANDGTVLLLKNGENATIYSKDGGGVKCPNTKYDIEGYPVSLFFEFAGKSLDVSGLDVSLTSNMACFFYYSSFTEIKGIDTFNTSNVTNMEMMFGGTNVPTIDLTNFDTSKVTNMSVMFGEGCNATKIIFGPKFDTSNVTDMSSMFESSHVESFDLTNFDTSKVTNMERMFKVSSKKVKFIKFGPKFDTSKVTNMSHMFNYLHINNLDLTNFDTSSVTNMSNMFHSSNIGQINLSSFNTNNDINMSSMFSYSTIPNLDLSSFNTSKITNMNGMFYNSKINNVICRTTEDMNKMKSSSSCPTTINFSVKNN